MATRRSVQKLTHQYTHLLSSNPYHQSLKSLLHLQTLTLPNPLQKPYPKFFPNSKPISYTHFTFNRHFCSNRGNDNENDEEDDEDDDEDDEEEDSTSDCGVEREFSLEEKKEAAAAIGYEVIGPLQRSDWVFKTYEPIFAVVQIGSHQFKVSNGDCLYTERLKFCEVNDKIILNRVLMLGSTTQTMIGRPVLPDAAVHAVVEEHALDAKVIIFKKKRRKNYRRTKGHRQELTKIRITEIQGIENPDKMAPGKTEKAAVKKVEKAAVEKVEKVAVPT